MTVAGRTRGMEFLQWFGLFGAFLIWVVQFVLGWGVGEARCGAANFVWHVDFDAWQIGLMAGNMVARIVGVIVAVISATLNLLFIGAYPVWSTIIIAVDVIVIYAIVVHGRELKV